MHLEVDTQTRVENDWTLSNIQARATETADETFFLQATWLLEQILSKCKYKYLIIL